MSPPFYTSKKVACFVPKVMPQSASVIFLLWSIIYILYITFDLTLMLFFFIFFYCLLLFSCLSLCPSSSWLVCKTWWQSIKKERTERETLWLLFFLTPLEMMQHSKVFEHSVYIGIVVRENHCFFSEFSIDPVSPSPLAVMLQKRTDIWRKSSPCLKKNGRIFRMHLAYWAIFVVS